MSRGNQDAVCLLTQGSIAAVAVADGCSQGRHSELGAGLGARFGVAQAVRRAAAGEPLADIAAAVMGDWQVLLELLAREMTPANDTLHHAVNEALLATLWVALAVDDRAIVFGVGDGLVCVDGVVNVIDQGAAPDYPAYAFCDGVTAPRLLVPHHGAFTHLVIGTDGAQNAVRTLDALTGDDKLAVNPSLLQKRLNVLRDSPHAPDDDCTLAVLTRRWSCS